MGSSVPAVLASLNTGLTTALSPVQITYINPEYIDLEEAEAVGIFLPSAIESTEELLTGNPGTQTEAYRVPLRIKVYQATGTPATVVTRVFQIYDGIRAYVAANPTLGGALVYQPEANVRVAEQREERAVQPVMVEGNRAGWVLFYDVDIQVSELIDP